MRVVSTFGRPQTSGSLVLKAGSSSGFQSVAISTGKRRRKLHEKVHPPAFIVAIEAVLAASPVRRQ